ncbi:MAG: cysteine desulfurase family protein, partial [Limisphaerales bacterium]
TESNHTAIHSALETTGRRRVVMSAVEHSANLQLGERLARRGVEVILVPVNPDGAIDLAALERATNSDTAIVSIMWANNETGVLFPVAEIASICRSRGVLCHTDAVQIPGKLPMSMSGLGVDFLSISGHKLHAPKGIGMLYVRRKTRFIPYLVGGHQERGRRAGTENVPYIVGLGRAAELAVERLDDEDTRVRALRNRLEDGLLERVPGTVRNGAREPRLPNTTNLAFDSVEAEAVLLLLDQAGFCASSGSACTTGSLDPSHVLTAMGAGPDRARGSLRFSLGHDNTVEEVDELIERLPPILAKLRAMSPSNPTPSD